MPSQRETNTMSEGLTKILNEVTKMKVMPDADLPFLVNLETSILNYLRAPTPETQAGAPMGPGGPPSMGGPPGVGGPGAMAPPPQMGGQMGPGPDTPPMPAPTGGAGGAGGGIAANPDELRRILQLGSGG